MRGRFSVSLRSGSGLSQTFRVLLPVKPTHMFSVFRVYCDSSFCFLVQMQRPDCVRPLTPTWPSCPSPRS